MSDTNVTLAIISQGWQAYQNRLSAALAPLTLEQIALRAAPDLRSIDELARHVIAVRAGWFHDALEEEALARFTPADLQAAIEKEHGGRTYTFTRGWVVWHVIEHDLHHGGEIAYSLGMHGLKAPDI